MQHYYSQIAGGYEELHREEQLGKLRLVMERISCSKDDRVLDVGCGTGLSSLLFPCFRAGVDSAIGMLQHAVKRMPVVQGAAESLPFRDNSFSIVICLTALHNFADPQRALLEMKRVCTGRFAISILKRAKQFDSLMNLVSKTFMVKEMLEDPHDVILFCG